MGGKCLSISINDTSELIYETERDLQTRKQKVTKWGKGDEGRDKLCVWD